ncbi:MAG: TonB-dependent receptor, partial [Alphaproteobacteria bacterium]|nr:TonB-dependent receptor [Alphaproteobacteria bacterium]
LFQQFGPNSNPIATLKPETATGWEIGFDKMFWDGRVQASLTWFSRTTTNQINFQSCFTPFDAPGCPTRVAVFGYYINVDKTRGEGIEAEVRADVTDTLKVDLNYTNMAAVNETTHLRLPRRPRDLASGTVTWRPLEGGTLGLSVIYRGKRFNDAGNFTPLTSTTRVNLFGSYDLTERWQLFGRVDNVFNDRTPDVSNYGVPGIGAYGGIRAAL